MSELTIEESKLINGVIKNPNFDGVQNSESLIKSFKDGIKECIRSKGQIYEKFFESFGTNPFESKESAADLCFAVGFLAEGLKTELFIQTIFVSDTNFGYLTSALTVANMKKINLSGLHGIIDKYRFIIDQSLEGIKNQHDIAALIRALKEATE